MTTTTTKPPLQLSVSPHCRSEPSPSSPGRRIPSWGSAASDDGPALSNYGECHMTPLPSPQGPRDWSNAGTNDAWNGRRSVGSVRHSRGRADSVFEEMRQGSPFDHYSHSLHQSPSARTSTDSPRDTSAAHFQPHYHYHHHTPPQLYASPGAPSFERPTSPTSGGDSSSAAAAAPTRSKTLDFFDTNNDATSPVLSPPPNPPSRTSSLRREVAPAEACTDASTLLSSLSVASAVSGRDRASSTSSVGSWLDREDAATLAVATLKATPSGRWAARARLSEMEKVPSAVHVSEPTGLLFVSSGPGTSASASGSNDATSSASKSVFVSTSPSPSPSPSSSPIPDRGDSDGVRRPHGTCSAAGAAPGRSSTIPYEGTARTTPPVAVASISTHGSTSSAMRHVPTSSSTLDSQNDESVPFKPGDMLGEYLVERVLGKGAFSRVVLGRRRADGPRAESYALKIISKKSYEDHERMRISVMREIEVLMTVHHPSLVSLSTSFATPLYTVLVLDYCAGGELFDFLARWHDSLFEGLARRIFGELCAAVGWMHCIGLVHRDIKLENALLVSRPFPPPAWGTSPHAILESLPRPFVKLTDFGLSRFIDLRQPTLTTRCGSEAYASPELIMGKPYDGRRTDAWALGVVLYAVVTGVLPFLEERAPAAMSAGGGGSVGVDAGGGSDEARKARRTYLLKIAKGEYHWPRTEERNSNGNGNGNGLITPAVKEVVARLLVRDPGKRARVEDLWDLEWMQGEGRAERFEGHVTRKVEGGGGEANVQRMGEGMRKGSVR
ncbi:BQ2448_7454 [Microbotryum intermedium]|uniref:BQ2448_7454 protein n=1 Tax=Microbotryum intermedium TaxID=269621 RepID=A0A238FQQ3_9BASI|nr:BQ2448_7454 [Microbotryum intermedium]